MFLLEWLPRVLQARLVVRVQVVCRWKCFFQMSHPEITGLRILRASLSHDGDADPTRERILVESVSLIDLRHFVISLAPSLQHNLCVALLLVGALHRLVLELVGRRNKEAENGWWALNH